MQRVRSRESVALHHANHATDVSSTARRAACTHRDIATPVITGAEHNGTAAHLRRRDKGSITRESESRVRHRSGVKDQMRRYAIAISVVLAVATCANGAFASTAAAGPSVVVKQKLAAIKASAAENHNKLLHYTWTETTEVTVDGRTVPSKVSNCRYGPDGKIHKTPVAGTSPSQTHNEGMLRKRIIERKKAAIEAYMAQVRQVIQHYVPPNPDSLQQAVEQKKVSFTHVNGFAGLEFKDYALKGDVMTLGFDSAAKQIRSLTVHSYVDTPQDSVTLSMDFTNLPDGTNHPSRSVLDAPGRGIHVVTTNSNYRKLIP